MAKGRYREVERNSLEVDTPTGTANFARGFFGASFVFLIIVSFILFGMQKVLKIPVYNILFDSKKVDNSQWSNGGIMAAKLAVGGIVLFGLIAIYRHIRDDYKFNLAYLTVGGGTDYLNYGGDLSGSRVAAIEDASVEKNYERSLKAEVAQRREPSQRVSHERPVNDQRHIL